jgi:enoyl-CoA hydratase/carnithine racemase
MDNPGIIVEKKGPAVWLTLNKPQRKNALGTQSFIDLAKALDEIERDPTVVAVVIKGSGDSFCAGIDLKDAAGSPDPLVRMEFKRLSEGVFKRIGNLDKILIALINGVCMAGGLELVLHCDIRIIDENAKIGDGHIRTGLIPNGGASQMLPHIIGIAKAKELLLTGDLVSGKDAERIGLVHRAVPADKLEETVNGYIAKFMDRPPLSLAAMKMVINRGMETSLESGLMLEYQTVKVLENTEDFKESIAAFMEKRKPIYKGR